MEIVKWHMMTVSSENEEVVSDNVSCMAISCWWPLACSLGEGLIVAAWGISSSLPIDCSFPDLSITFLEAWISVLDKERILHGDRSWRFKFDHSIINLVGTYWSQLDLGLGGGLALGVGGVVS